MYAHRCPVELLSTWILIVGINSDERLIIEVDEFKEELSTSYQKIFSEQIFIVFLMSTTSPLSSLNRYCF